MYKEKLETLINQFKLQINLSESKNSIYCNELLRKYEFRSGERFKEIDDKITNIRADNSKFITDLNKKMEDLDLELDKMHTFKNDFTKKNDSIISRTFFFIIESRHILEKGYLRLIQSDLETESAEFMEKHVKGFGDAGVRHRVTLDDGLVCLGAAGHVVGLDREDLLEGVGRAICLQGPDLHLTEALAAELGLAAQRLLGHQAVGAGGTGVHLVVNQVVKL